MTHNNFDAGNNIDFSEIHQFSFTVPTTVSSANDILCSVIFACRVGFHLKRGYLRVPGALCFHFKLSRNCDGCQTPHGTYRNEKLNKPNALRQQDRLLL